MYNDRGDNMRTVHFGIEDLVGNLFITLKEYNYENIKISYHLIDIYSDILKKELKKVGLNSIFNLSRDNTFSFLARNSHLYTEYNDTYIRLITDMSIDDLIELYRGYLLLDAAITIESPTVKEAIVNAYNEELKNNKVKNRILNVYERKK